jgi:hypothetical protein
MHIDGIIYLVNDKSGGFIVTGGDRYEFFTFEFK